MNLILPLLLLLPASPVVASPRPFAMAVESVDDLLKAGRALLAEGKVAEARGQFEAAEKLERSLKTRQWVLRAWIAESRVNDALNEIDALAKGGAGGAAVDYLYGMAFAQKAKGYIVEGVSGGIVAMAFGDAVEFLKKATSAEPELYADAFAALAESAWYAQDLGVARAAADKAVTLRPKDGDAWFLLGRIAFSQYSAVQADEARAAEADKAWTSARDAFTKAAELFATSPDAAARAKGAEASNQIGWLHVWKKQGDEAAKRFGAAIAVDPSTADYGALRESLSPDQFVAALEDASRLYETLYGKETTGDATLLWWLGFGRYTAKRYEEAEAAFTRAVAKAPAFANSWYYIALARYFRQDYDGAIAAFRTHHGMSPEDAAASIRANQEENLRILDYMIGMKAAKAANLDAAFLSELQTLVVPDNGRYWNNLGLFLRDEADSRVQRGRREMSAEEHKQVMDLYERSFASYRRSLEIAPNDPNYLNDAAVLLDYNLDRDLDQARTWYVKAAEMAEIELARKDIDAETRGLREIALRDSRNNLKRLDAKLEKRKKEKEGGTPPPSGGTPPAPGGNPH
ncbi:MAG: tetratricopeptide repeat protein [Planctomycetota bacterium]|nr:tetratricopeptide repeat protein [Planctomycetota bacterium]